MPKSTCVVSRRKLLGVNRTGRPMSVHSPDTVWQTPRMTDVDEFLAVVLPRLRAAEMALHEGNPEPRRALWSHGDPVTLFGAEVERSGWEDLDSTFQWLASRFTACDSLEYEVVAAGVSGDLAYLVAYEHITATVGGEVTTYSLRATTVFRLEDEEWRVAHRHGDAVRG